MILSIIEIYVYKLLRIKNLNLTSYKAMNILDERLAKGEIDEREYISRKSEIFNSLY